MPPRPRGRQRGGLEREILACLAAAGRPMSPGEVRAELDDQLAYTTVMTTLSRLHAKGAVFRAPAGRGFAYELRGGPADAQASMTARRMLVLLQGGGDRAGVLSRFVADLSPEDEQLLSDLLADSGPADPGSGSHLSPDSHPSPGAAPGSGLDGEPGPGPA